MDKAPEAFRTISEVADDLDVPQHVLRFWESRFAQIRPMKRGGGRRYYRPDDIDLLRGIRHLLYGQGYTIRGVQRILREQGPRFVQAVWQEGAPQPPVGHGGEEPGETARAGERGLFGLWPAMGAKEEIDTGGSDEAAAEQAAPAPHVRLAPPPAKPALGADDLKRLRATLDDLVACRKLLDSAFAD
ncbi:MAG TPA: MerR family transcriptional regulator [Xanthobacteraceae bacterium]